MRSRKKTLKVTVDEMRNFSFAYIERYAPSKQQLRTYLLKKYLKANLENIKKQDITDLIDVVLQDLEKTKFINDKFYSESKSRSLIQRGSSVNKIRNYLMTKGINDRYIKETIDKIKEEADAELARKLVEEKNYTKRRVKIATGNLIAATDWKLDRARDTGADNTDILAERQALRDKSNALEDVIDALKDEDEMNEFGWSDQTLEKK